MVQDFLSIELGESLLKVRHRDWIVGRLSSKIHAGGPAVSAPPAVRAYITIFGCHSITLFFR